MRIRQKQSEPYHLLVYVESCSTKLKKFKSLSTMKTFVTKFKKKYPDLDRGGDNWIDFTVTHIYGAIVIYPESCIGPVDE